MRVTTRRIHVSLTALTLIAAMVATSNASPDLGKPGPVTHRNRPGGAVAPAPAGSGLPKHIFGSDDRIDLYQETNPLRQELAASTCALVMSFRVKDNEDGTYHISTSPLRGRGRVCVLK